MYLAGLPQNQLDEHPGHEAGADAHRDGVGERHQHDRQEGRDGDLDVRPGDTGDLLHHQEAHQHQSRHGRLARDDGHQRSDEHRDEEEQAGDDAGQAGTSTFADTRCRLDVARVGRDSRHSTSSGSDRVDHQDLLGVGRCALRVEQTSFGADGSHSAHRVEEVGQHQCEDQQEGRDDPEVAEASQQVELTDRAEVRHVEQA